jgi:hypothetical protein
MLCCAQLLQATGEPTQPLFPEPRDSRGEELYNQLRQAETRVCSRPGHVEAERIRVEHGQACFQLKDHLERACISHPNDSIAEECALDDVLGDDTEREIGIAIAIQDALSLHILYAK